MAISLATKEIGLSCSEKYKRLTLKGLETCADGPGMDNADFGSALAINGNNLEFNNNFLRITILVNCNWNEFVDPNVLVLKFNSDSNGNNGITIFDNNVKWNINAVASRDQGLKKDPRVLIHINVPTINLYNTNITSIYCKCEYGYDGLFIKDRKTVSGYWNLKSSGIQIYRGYKWTSDGYINNVGGSGNNIGYYTTKENTTLIPHTNCSSTINLLSKTNNGGTNSVFFTKENGKMTATINLPKYFSTYVDDSNNIYQYYRKPAYLFLYGERNDNSSEPVEIEIRKNTETTDESIDIINLTSNEHYRVFKKITSAKMSFVKNGTKFSLTINENNRMEDGDDLRENQIKLNINNNGNIINKYVTHTRIKEEIDWSKSKYKESITLKTVLNGTIDVQTNCPYEFKNTSAAKIIRKNDGETMYENVSIILENGKIKFSMTDEYISYCEYNSDSSTKPTPTFEKGKLVTGTDYYLECPVYCRLQFGNQNSEVATDLKINLNSAKFQVQNENNNKYIAFGDSKPLIKYKFKEGERDSWKEVPGDIIIPNEYLTFSNRFYVYDLNNYKEVFPSAYIKIQNKKFNNDLEVSKNSFSYCSYEAIATEIFSKKQDETRKMENTPIKITYYFKNQNAPLENVYSFVDEFVVGRITNEPEWSFVNSDEGEMKYFLIDNGGDRNVNYNSQTLTANQLINLRKTKTKYFSLSRKPSTRDSIAQEFIVFSLVNASDEDTANDISKTLFIQNTTLFYTLIEMLSEGRTNTFSFLELIKAGIFSDEEKDKINNLLSKSKLDFSISLNYLYGEDSSGNYIFQTIFNVTKDGLVFIHPIEPFGLRKNGAIINPKRENDVDEDLDKKDTFLINTKNITGKKPNPDLDEIVWEQKRGLKIVFNTIEQKKDGSVYNLPTFEIYLDENGEICFSNGTKTFNAFETIEAFSKIEAIQKHLNLSDEQLKNLLSS